MDWWWCIPLAVIGVFFVVRQSQKQARDDVASFDAAIKQKRDEQLLEAIKFGMRVFNWRDKTEQYWRRDLAHGQFLFEDAHVIAYHVEHKIESRVGFYLKGPEEFGMWSGFAGNGDEYYISYYRTDRSFQLEERLVD